MLINLPTEASSNSTNISLDDINVPNMNMSAMLNIPTHSHRNSVFKEFKTMVKSHRERKSHQMKPSAEDKKAMKEFTFINPFKEGDDEKEEKLSVKPFMKMNYDDYLKKVKNTYETFNVNHNGKSNQEDSQDEGTIVKEYRSRSNEILQKIRRCFNQRENEYKIEDELLSMKLDDIQMMIINLISHSGMIDNEINSIVEEHKYLHKILLNKLPEMNSQVDIMSNIIKDMKNRIFHVKQKMMLTSSKVMIAQSKKKNLKKILTSLKSLQGIKDIVSNNKYDRLKEGNELIQSLSVYKTVKVLSDINKMMNNLISSRNDNEVNEIVNSFKDYITDNISLVNEIDENDEMLTKIEETYHLEKHLSLKFKNTEIQNIVDKISPFSSNKSVITSITKKINSIVSDSFVSLISNIISVKSYNEILFFYFVIKSSIHYLSIISSLFTIVVDSSTMIGYISTTLLSILNENLSFIFLPSNNINKTIDDFIIKSHLIKTIIEKFSSNQILSSYQSLIEKTETEYTNHCCDENKTKLLEAITNDTFTSLSSIPSMYQIFIDKIINFDLSQVDSYEKNRKYFLIEDIKSSIISIETKEKKTLLTSSTLSIIDIIYTTIKMMSSFSINVYNTIVISMFTSIDIYLSRAKAIVIDNETNMDVTQNEISMLYSNVSLIDEMILSIVRNDKNKILNVFIPNMKSYVDNYTEKSKEVKKNCEAKIKEMINIGIVTASLDEFKAEMNKDSYTIPSQVNEFAMIVVKRTKAIYTVIKNIFDDSFVVSVFEDSMNQFVEGAEDIMITSKELSTEEEKKQFKKDFLFIKKYINQPPIDELLEMKSFKKSISSVYKKILPKQK